ncbi:Protein of unknown function [Pyronema omphalodes CBS 100304]|uniref:Uncharacterized protein n=1 Tax=Pyronema omphalodes (strain CBS 100304) TaxID=1076935 RepID=U4L7X5_PYROM|nr:Protein of unknown function [Pyronema omphalodes CBS 100304]
MSRITQIETTPEDVIEVSRTSNESGPYIYAKRDQVFKNFGDFEALIMPEWGLDLSIGKYIFFREF